MKQIVVGKSSGSSECYQINTLLFSEDALEKEIPEHFIIQDYARWRVLGRDSILKLEKASEFEA